MAALTVSMDRIAARYAAACETNGHRVEMITTNNIETMIKPLLQEWCSNVNEGRLPEHVLYFRDGVSEGQYQHVLQQEVRDLKRIFEMVNPNTVVSNHIIICLGTCGDQVLTCATGQIRCGCGLEAPPHPLLPWRGW